MWSAAWNIIANCNNLAQQVAEEDTMLFYKRTQEKNMILGEAIALRAYMHFDLLRIYAPSLAMNPGDRLFIPYVDKYPSYLSDRQTVGYCLERIIADLVEAQKILKDVDKSSEFTSGNRFTKSPSGEERFVWYRGFHLNYHAVTAELAYKTVEWKLKNKGDEDARGHIGTELNNKAETVLLVEKDKSNGDISNVSAMHIRAMDFEPFAFRINDNALPELIEGYRPEAKKPGRPEEEKFDPYRHISEQQHRIALEAAFGLKEEYGYKDLETSLIKSYMSVGVKLNHQKAVSLITMLRNKRMIVQENGRKYTFKPDFHY